MFLYICISLFLAAVVSTQSSKATVPSDLSSQFDPNSIALQVSYNGNAEEGLLDGASVTQQVSSNAPLFALGDSSGVNTVITFVIAMVDTTMSNRVLHFLQPDFKADGTQTGISSNSKPAIAYQAPGTLGDTGIRQYSWLLYQQSGSFPAKSLPALGQDFDVEGFQTANNLKSALAGIAMVVEIAGATTPATTSVTVAPSLPASTSSALPPPPVSSSPSSPPVSTSVITTTTIDDSSITSSIPSVSVSVTDAATFISVAPTSTVPAAISSIIASAVSAAASNATSVASISSSLTQGLGNKTSAVASAQGSASTALQSASTTLASQRSTTASSTIVQSTGGAPALTQDILNFSILSLMIALAGFLLWF